MIERISMRNRGHKGFEVQVVCTCGDTLESRQFMSEALAFNWAQSWGMRATNDYRFGSNGNRDWTW